MHRGRRLAVTTACLFAFAAPARSLHPISTPAPEFVAGADWLNAKPLSLGRLRDRRVVLVAFINAANVNSLRALKTLNRWWEAYSLSGLMLIGVHSAEYDFQRDRGILLKELRRRGVLFPVVADDDRALWRAYGNEGWPSFYVIDHRGRVVYDQIGEGRYRELESALRQAMTDAGYPPPPFPVLAVDPPVKDCGAATDEIQTGAAPAKAAQAGGVDAVLAGKEGELLRRGDWIRLIYRGAESYAVLGPARGKPAKFMVKQDDLWLHAGNAGGDVLFDSEGRSYVEVSEPRLYRLTQNADDNAHSLAVMSAPAGGSVYGFSFSDRCLRYAP